MVNFHIFKPKIANGNFYIFDSETLGFGVEVSENFELTQNNICVLS